MGRFEGVFAVAPYRLATLVLLCIGFVGVVWLNWPGHLSYDSVVQLLDGRTGRYHTWHPPFMAWLLGLCDHLVRGAGLFIALQALLLFGSLGALVWLRPSISPLAPALVLGLFALPHVVLWQAIVWKDVLFADLMVAGFTLLWASCRRPGLDRWSWTLIALAFLGLSGATLVRQNGLFALLLGGAALGHDLYRKADGPIRRRLLKAIGVVLPALLAGFALILVATAGLKRRSIDGDGGEAQIHMLQTYDVVGVAAHDPAARLDKLPPGLAPLIRSTARTLYTPQRNDDLLHNAFDRTTAAAADEMEAQWLDLLVHHPEPWLRHRLEVFGWIFASPHRVCYSEATGVDGPAPMLKALHMAAGQNGRDLALEQYAGAFYGAPVYSHLFYGALALVLMVALFRSRAHEDAVFGFMLAAAWLFVLSFFLIGVACDYRYLYALDLTTIVAGFHWTLGLRMLALGRRRLPA